MSEKVLLRVGIAKKAIEVIRKMDATDPERKGRTYPIIAYGAYGLLEWVETGALYNIKELRLRDEVEKLMKEAT